MVKKLILILILILSILLSSVLYEMSANAAYTVTHNQIIINANSNNNNGISAFPESYQILLKKLVTDTGHTNWKFKAFYTDISWSELTSNENVCLKNTIYKTNPSCFCSCNRQGDSGFYCASAQTINYYLDPRNFLLEKEIFQFLDLSNSTVTSISEIQSAVAGTYLAGSVNGMNYAEMIYNAAAAANENALSIIVKIFQELGRGTAIPKMISGTVPGYENVYNFFNFGATDGEGNIQRGLEYARNAGWTTPEKALVEGSKLIANTYMKTGQNTKYTLKFDIVDDAKNGLFWHQYCTNVQDPSSQAKSLYTKYKENSWLNKKLTFIIPVYKDMPAWKNMSKDTYKVPNQPSRDNLTSFNDISKSDWFYEPVKYCYDNKIILGLNNETFSPHTNITRGQLVTIIWRMEGEEEAKSVAKFIDVPENSYYYNAINWAYEKGIINGYGNNIFAPQTNITRQQLAVILCNYAKYKGIYVQNYEEISGFEDINDISEYAKDSVKWAISNGIINGVTKNNRKYITPLNTATRAETAAMLYNYTTKFSV